MSTEQNKAVLRRWFEAWNTRDVNVLDKLADETMTADYVLHHPFFSGGQMVGLAGWKQTLRGILKWMPDIHFTLEDVVPEGDRVASRWTYSGTVASTGKPETWLSMSIGRFVGGKIAEEWEIAVQAGEARDPAAVVKALDAAYNAGDLDGVLALFAEDASIRDPVEGQVYTGTQQIREWFAPQLGHAHVESRNHQVSGDTVTWEGILTGEAVREMGSDAIEETAEAVVQDGKITSFALTIVGQRP